MSFHPGCTQIKISIVVLYSKGSTVCFFNCFKYCGQLVAGTAK